MEIHDGEHTASRKALQLTTELQTSMEVETPSLEDGDNILQYGMKTEKFGKKDEAWAHEDVDAATKEIEKAYDEHRYRALF